MHSATWFYKNWDTAEILYGYCMDRVWVVYENNNTLIEVKYYKNQWLQEVSIQKRCNALILVLR